MKKLIAAGNLYLKKMDLTDIAWTQYRHKNPGPSWGQSGDFRL